MYIIVPDKESGEWDRGPFARLDRRLGFGPANQIIRITPQNCQIPLPVIHYYLTLT